MEYNDIKDEIPRLENGKLNVVKWYKESVSTNLTNKYGEGLYKIFPKEDMAEIYRHSIKKIKMYLIRFDKSPKDEITIKFIKEQKAYIKLYEETITDLLQQHT
jgi:hypothetical protein